MSEDVVLLQTSGTDSWSDLTQGPPSVLKISTRQCALGDIMIMFSILAPFSRTMTFFILRT